MRFAETKGERDAGELARRLYRIEGERPAAIEKEAARALVAANPFLKKATNVPGGTLVAVPELPGAEPADATIGLEQAAGGPLVAQLKELVTSTMGELEQALEDERAEAGETLDLLKSRELKAAVRETPEAEDQVAEVSDATRSRIKDARTLDTHRAAVVAQVEDDLAELLSALHPPGGP